MRRCDHCRRSGEWTAGRDQLQGSWRRKDGSFLEKCNLDIVVTPANPCDIHKTLPPPSPPPPPTPAHLVPTWSWPWEPGGSEPPGGNPRTAQNLCRSTSPAPRGARLCRGPFFVTWFPDAGANLSEDCVRASLRGGVGNAGLILWNPEGLASRTAADRCLRRRLPICWTNRRLPSSPQD